MLWIKHPLLSCCISYFPISNQARKKQVAKHYINHQFNLKLVSDRKLFKALTWMALMSCNFILYPWHPFLFLIFLDIFRTNCVGFSSYTILMVPDQYQCQRWWFYLVVFIKQRGLTSELLLTEQRHCLVILILMETGILLKTNLYQLVSRLIYIFRYHLKRNKYLYNTWGLVFLSNSSILLTKGYFFWDTWYIKQWTKFIVPTIDSQ